uniref:Uncharacterized protein n=1 Tax=Glossina pallidipes TaxID=7398 RepID=A0A1A9ZCJ9_GLOPL
MLKHRPKRDNSKRDDSMLHNSLLAREESTRNNTITSSFVVGENKPTGNKISLSGEHANLDSHNSSAANASDTCAQICGIKNSEAVFGAYVVIKVYILFVCGAAVLKKRRLMCRKRINVFYLMGGFIYFPAVLNKT